MSCKGRLDEPSGLHVRVSAADKSVHPGDQRAGTCAQRILNRLLMTAAGIRASLVGNTCALVGL